MDAKTFKNIFSDAAKAQGFTYNFGGWFKNFSEYLFVLELQKSNYGNSYYLNIKIFFAPQGSSTLVKSKELVRSNTCDISSAPPKEFVSILDLDIEMDDAARKQGVENIFTQFMLPFMDNFLTKEGVLSLADKNQVLLGPRALEKWGRKWAPGKPNGEPMPTCVGV